MGRGHGVDPSPRDGRTGKVSPALALVVQDAIRRPQSKAKELELELTPIGPFHSTVLDLATTALNAAVDSGPTSRPIKPSVMPSASVAVPTTASAPNLSPVA